MIVEEDRQCYFNLMYGDIDCISIVLIMSFNFVELSGTADPADVDDCGCAFCGKKKSANEKSCALVRYSKNVCY